MVKQALWSTLLGSQLGPCKVIRHLKPLIYLCAKLSFEVSQFHAVLVNALLQPQSNSTGLLARNSITYLLVGLLAFNKFSSRIDHNYRIMSGDSHSSCQNSGARQDTGYKEATWSQNFIPSKRLVWYKKSSSFSHFKSSPRSTSPGRARVRITICFMMRAPPSLFSRLDKLSSFPSHLSLSLLSPSLSLSLLWSFTSLEFSHFLSRSRSIYDCGSRGRTIGDFYAAINHETGLPTDIRLELSFVCKSILLHALSTFAS